MDPEQPLRKPRLLERLTSAFPSRRNGRSGETDPSATSTPTPSTSPAEIRLRISEFEAARVFDVMIPRAGIVAIEESTPLPELIRIFGEGSHSRLPVYRETLDDPVGLVHIKDVIGLIATRASQAEEEDPVPLKRLRRDILYVPPSMRLADLMVKMQATRIHLALVVDEYGGTDGLVSLEDLVEQIVGEIEDEHDSDDPGILKRGRGTWDVDARIEIDDFADESGLDMSLPDYEDDIDTLGGVVVALAGRVPQRGEIIGHPNETEMEILDGDTRRVKRLRLRVPAALLPEQAPAERAAEAAAEADHPE